uniref:LOW QUALITY PROTEIN: leucine-rich repeat-containing protein 24 n=1 Tax=Nyctereutes procyonoides TaxID=34880 RepID=UPI0024449786|nr:LOW QUALITY PROTEIN: leucine-rich repeat-containing protein 24 [Nyctereutes procyonoides]
MGNGPIKPVGGPRPILTTQLFHGPKKRSTFPGASREEDVAPQLRVLSCATCPHSSKLQDPPSATGAAATQSCARVFLWRLGPGMGTTARVPGTGLDFMWGHTRTLHLVLGAQASHSGLSSWMFLRRARADKQNRLPRACAPSSLGLATWARGLPPSCPQAHTPGGTSHPGWTIRRPRWRPQLRGPRPVPREMAPGAPTLLLLWLLWLPGCPPRAAACPAACRCYSATVECGALRLRGVPPGIPPGTQTLFLQDNSIARLDPGVLAPLAALRRLYLHNNSLRALEPGAFRAQSRLLELALTGNRLRGLRVGAFAGLAQLRALYLAGNQLGQLLDFTFLHLPRLQELHLQDNSIELLEDQALAGLSSLALLDLSRNHLGTLSREALRPLASLQVLRLTENPWRCDCALHWLGAWIKEGGQRLLSSRDKKIVCAEPPRLALQSLLDVSGSSLICIPPSVHVEPLEVTANLGEDLRVACQASGYPQPLVTWRKVAQPRDGQMRGQAQAEGGASRPGGPGGPGGPDTGSGMLFLSNITLAHAGKYECEASNAGGAARVPFQLLVNLSRPQPPQPAPPPPLPAGPVSHQPLQETGSMAFRALGLATQTAVAAAIALLALTALLLAAMICRRRRKRKKAPGPPGEGALFVNDYSDGPCTFAQLEELRDERGHEMFVIDRSKPLFADAPTEAAGGTGPGLPLQPPTAYEIHC